MALRSASSKRYANALLESVAAHGDTSLDIALKDVTSFARAVEESFDLRNALMNPLFTEEERMRALSAVSKAMHTSETVQRFFVLLIERDRMGEIAEIAEAFSKLADERRGRVRAEVQAASPLTPEATDRLRRALERSTGKTIELSVTVDPSLLGGVRARVGSMVFDGSIRAELDRLKTALTRSE
jgi:F-type H+-transporting ATPase subunit delta